MPNTMKAVLWMLGAVVSLTTMAVSGREISAELDTFEIMMYRSFIGVFIVLVVGGFSGSLKTVSRECFGLHLIRNVCHFIGQNLWFYALALIPIAQVITLEFSTPIWVALMAPFFLGEQLSKIRMVTVAMGFCGILIVAQPGNITIGPGVISAALCAVGFAGAFITTKLLARTDSVTSILFWLTTMQLLFGIACAFYDGDVTVPSVASLPLLALLGISGLLGHYCLTSAFKLAPILFVSPIDFIRLPLVAVIGAVFYNEGVNIWLVLGAIIILSANLLNIWNESKSKAVSPSIVKTSL